jgi:hypothetical protein
MPTTNTTTEDTIRVPLCDAVRTALVDLLTTGQHHDAATPATLTAIGAARRALAELHGAWNPASRCAHDEDRHVALSSALGDIARALLTARPGHVPDPTELRAGLTTLTAVALAWLDTLPAPNPEPNDDGYDHDDGYDAEPF